MIRSEGGFFIARSAFISLGYSALLEHLLQLTDHVGLLLLGEREDLLERDADVRDVLLDVLALALGVGLAAAVADELRPACARTPAARA